MMPLRLLSLRLVCALLCAGALAGCPSDMKPAAPDMAGSCNSSADCQGSMAGHVCFKQQCVVCATNQDCPQNQVCDNGTACVDCLASKDCMPNYRCQKKACTLGCDENSLCAAGSYCDLPSNQCVQCRNEADCASVSGKPRCDVALHQCFECVTDDQCGAGKVCLNHGCKVGCSGAHPQCPTGLVCFVAGGACVTCVVDNDCKNPNTPRCNANNACVACLPQNDNCPVANYCAGETCKPGCRNNADCNGQPGKPECDTTAHACVPCVTDAPCGLGQVCMNQKCVAGCTAMHACPGAQGCCAGVCTSVLSDVNHCGNCDTVCPMGSGCCAGTCVPLNSLTNCGGCGKACFDVPNGTKLCDPKTLTCVIGSCNPGYLHCGQSVLTGCESLVANDPKNCGACNNLCPNPPNAVAACSGSKCGLGACNTNFADCNGDPKDGCEINLLTDAQNCSACKMACPAVANGTPGCAGGACGIASCNKSYADCNNDPKDGCEISLLDNRKNCGACNAACGNNLICVGGKCVAGCAGPFTASPPVPLDLALSGVDFNFHPQGMVFDETEGQQGAFDIVVQGPQAIFVVGTDGKLIRQVPITPVGDKEFKYMTSIAVDASFYYIVDYTGNKGSKSLFRVAKTGGAPIAISTSTTAFSGYPLAVGGGNLYRGNDSTKYSWSNVSQILVAPLANPDNVQKTLSTAVTGGIGDLTWDGTELWALAFTNPRQPDPDNEMIRRVVDLYRLDPNSGNTIESYTSVYTTMAPLVPAALAYANGALWVFNYSEKSDTPGTLTRLACH